MQLSNVLMLIALLFATCALSMFAAAPYQELAPRAGHVPVYIRVGNTPLTEIHPGLAEAFREFESANLVLGENSSAPLEPHAVATTTPSATTAAAAAAPTATTPATATTKTTESDIASFEAVKSMKEASDGVQAPPATSDDDAKAKAEP